MLALNLPSLRFVQILQYCDVTIQDFSLILSLILQKDSECSASQCKYLRHRQGSARTTNEPPRPRELQGVIKIFEYGVTGHNTNGKKLGFGTKNQHSISSIAK